MLCSICFQDTIQTLNQGSIKIVAINVHARVRRDQIPYIENASKSISNIIHRLIREKDNQYIAVIGTTDYTHAGNLFSKFHYSRDQIHF